MAALAQDRDTPMKGEKGHVITLPVAASTKIYAGAMVALASGYAVPAGDTSGHIVMGRAEEQIDNSSGSNGDKSIDVCIDGVFKWNVSSLAQAQVGGNATVVDDNTVGKAADTTNDIVAGKIVQLDSDGAWVRTP